MGPHRSYRLASVEVADAIHALMAVTAGDPKRHRPPGPRDDALRLARTCYDHMAGRLALAVADSFSRERHVALSDGAALVTDEGRRFFVSFGLDLKDARVSARPRCRTCLD